MKAALLLILSLLVSAVYADEVSIKDARKVYYLLASSKGFGQSGFGHGYLRIGINDKPSNDDYVIEFVADVTPEKLASVSGYLRAIGIGENFDRSVVVKRYKEIVPEMNYQSNRDLTSYEILVTEEQRQSFLNTLDGIVQSGTMDSYSFLNKNCAQAVSELLNSVGIKMKGLSSVIPTEIPSKLAKANLIGEVHTDYSITNRRINLSNKYKEDLKDLINSPLEHLSSDDIYKRITAYSELTKSLNGLEGQRRTQLKAYLSSFTFLERRIIRQALINQLKNQSEFNESIFKQSLKILNSRVLDTYLVYDKEKVLLKHRIESTEYGRGGVNRKLSTTTTELSDISFDGARILHKGSYLGLIAPKNLSSNRIILTHSWLTDFSYYDREHSKLEIRTILFMSNALKTRQDLDKNDESILKNNIASMPMCAGLMDAQKALMTKVIFNPDKERLSEELNTLLYAELLRGKIIVVPGYKDINEWTSTLNKDVTEKLTFQYHMEKYRSVGAAISTYFAQESINQDTINLISALTQDGVYVPVIFRTKNGLGHAILVTGIKNKDSNKVFIEAYDPNIGFTKDVFVFDMKEKQLSSFLYGSSKAYVIDTNFSDDYEINELTQGEELRKLIINLSTKYNKNSFSLSEIASGY